MAACSVKAAKQAIQLVEYCYSNDYSSTVPYKVTEAAARTEKRSVEVISKQRMIEERVAGEMKSMGFWKWQAREVEADVGKVEDLIGGDGGA